MAILLLLGFHKFMILGSRVMLGTRVPVLHTHSAVPVKALKV